MDAHGRGSYVTSAGAGPSIGKHILMSYLPPEYANVGQELAVEYMTERYPVTVQTNDSAPLLDPDNARVKAADRDPGMRILVCVKRVPLTGGKMVLTADEQALETRHLGFTISPHEECGVEEAVRLVEEHGGEVTVLTLGPAEAEEQIRDSLANGGDRGVHLVTDGEEWDPQATAAVIVATVRHEESAGGGFDLIVFGNESADAGNYQVGIRVAYALGRPIATGLKGLSVAGRPRALRAGGARRPRHLRPAAARRCERARGDQPAALPVRAGEAARALEAGRVVQPRAAGAAAREAAPRGAAGPGQAGGGPRQRARRPRRAWWRSCARSGWPDGVLVLVEPRRGALASGALPRPRPRRAACTRSPSTPPSSGAYGVDTVHVAEHEQLSSYAPAAWAACLDQLIDQSSPMPWSPPARTEATRCSAISPHAAISPSPPTASRSGVTAPLRECAGADPARRGAHHTRT